MAATWTVEITDSGSGPCSAVATRTDGEDVFTCQMMSVPLGIGSGGAAAMSAAIVSLARKRYAGFAAKAAARVSRGTDAVAAAAVSALNAGEK